MKKEVLVMIFSVIFIQCFSNIKQKDSCNEATGSDIFGSMSIGHLEGLLDMQPYHISYGLRGNRCSSWANRTLRRAGVNLASFPFDMDPHLFFNALKRKGYVPQKLY